MAVTILRSPITEADVTFADNATKSASVDTRGRNLVGFQTEANWLTGNVSLEGSNDDTTFVPLLDVTGTAYSATSVAASYGLQIDWSVTLAYRYIKFVSSVSQTSGPLTCKAQFRGGDNIS